jgi:hypothetical protein
MTNTIITPPPDRIPIKMEEVKREYGGGIVDLLKELNRIRLKSKGRLTSLPITDRKSLRWTLAWKTERVSYEMSVIVRFDDDGQVARVAGVWVHRHASTPMDYEGHTPTTRMHRLATLSIAGIREAIDAEWG